MHRSRPHRRLSTFVLTAAGLLLCLAACRPAVPSSDGAAFSIPAQAAFPAPPHSLTSAAHTGRDSIRSPATTPARLHADTLVTLSQTDPRAALLASAGQNLGPAATYLRGNFLQLWAERDFTAALAYADELAPGPEREEMLARLALLLAASLPAEAADIVARDMSPGATRDEAAISVLHRWTLADPVAARAWASAFPAGPLRERALREITGASPAAKSASR